MIIQIIIGAIIPLFFVGILVAFLVSMARLDIIHNKKMEEIGIDFIESMRKIASLYGESKVHYLVPTGKETFWDKLFGRARLRLFVYNETANQDAMDPFVRESRYTYSISKKTFFHLKLKNVINTEDRDLAMETMKYLKITNRKLP